jgi:hypothetical protein
VAEDVEQTRAGGLRQEAEVALPHAVGVRFALPHVPAGVVHHAAAVELVHGPDDVVEVAPLEEIGDPVLGAGDEVGLDPEPQRRRADELAIGVEVVGRLLLPERMPRDVEGLAEAVHVLGDAQLVDPRLLCRVQVALHVLVGEVAVGRRAGIVRA